MSKMIRELNLNELEAVVGGVDAVMAARRHPAPAPAPRPSTGSLPSPTSGSMNPQPNLI